jgi:hypothetical protein
LVTKGFFHKFREQTEDMKIFHKRKSNDITFEFTERKYTNKLKALLSYSKHTINTLIYKRKSKPKFVWVRFEWRYRDPETLILKNSFWNANLSLFSGEHGRPITRRNLLPFIRYEMENYLEGFYANGSNTIEPYKIHLEFVYPNETTS